MHQDNKNKRGDIKKTVSSSEKEIVRNTDSMGILHTKKSSNVNSDLKKYNSDLKITGSLPKVKKIGNCNIPAIFACIVMVLFLVAEKILNTASLSGNNLYIAVSIAQFLVFILPCAFYSAIANHKFNSGLSYYNFRPFSPKILGFAFFSLLILLFGNMIIKYFGYIIFGTVTKSTVLYSHDNIFALSFATIIVPAVTEEILFRGVIFTEYEKRNTGAIGAILCSSLLFVFIHFDIKSFISYLYAGIILAITLHITRSLFVPIIVHLLNNSVCLFTDTFLKRVSKESISSVFVMFILIVLFLISLFFWLENIEWICAGKSIRINDEKDEYEYKQPSRLIPQHQKFRNVLSATFLAPAFIVAVIIYIFASLIIK